MAYVVKRNGRFTGYYRIGGKRLSAGTWANQTEAMYHAMQSEQSGSIAPAKAQMTLSEFLDSWLVVADLLPITKKGYESILRNYVVPKLGDRKVTQISKREIIELLDDLKMQGVGSATLGQIKASLGSAFSKLIQTGQITSNPTQGIRIKQRHADLKNVLEPQEFKEVLSNLESAGAKLLAQFLVVSGCRFGEATELRVRDLNFKTGELFVQRRVSDLGASHTSRFMVIEATKSGHKRSLMLSKALLQEIQEYVRVKALSKDDLLFSRLLVAEPSKIKGSRSTKSSRPFEKDGKKFEHGTLYSYTHGSCRCEGCREAMRKHHQKRKPYQKQRRFIDQTSHLPRDVWRTIWNKAIDKSAIGWSPRTHDLRHANATQLLKNGVDVHEVKERLGHQSIKTTERYLHRLRHNQSEASEIANDFLE